MNQAKTLFLVLIATVTVLTVLIVVPFFEYVLMAVLLAYVLRPLQTRLGPRVGSTIAAALLVVFAIFSLILPIVVMVVLIADDAMAVADGLDEFPVLADVEAEIANLTGIEMDLAEQLSGSIESIIENMLGTAVGVFGAVVHALIGLGLAVFLLFFLLRDREKLMEWIRDISPFPDEMQTELYDRLDTLVWAVLVGHVAVAIVQGVLAGAGLWVTGVPNAAFWTMVMVFLSLIPILGSFLVWAPAAAWLFFTGSTVAAGFLFVYGAIVVGLSDEFLRPLIVGRVDISPSLIIVGVIGGLYLLGFVGLFFGPIIVGGFKIVLEIYDEWYHQLDEQAH